VPVSFTRFPQCIRPICLLYFAMHGLETKLGESQTANCNGFRPASTFREFLNLEVLRFVSLSGVNEAKRLNDWNDWNWLRFLNQHFALIRPQGLHPRW
jgi:hypothetical protein